jgi:D-lyxose ketol-isomerase
MKRSEIDRWIDEAVAFFDQHGFKLPPFAFWSAEQWDRVGAEADEIRACRLGWDVTDFGSGRFAKIGLTLFTLRNGRVDDPRYSKSYAEKIMMVGEGQMTPMHFHWKKTEDIINRGAGMLVVELFNSDTEEQIIQTPVRVSCDGVIREVAPGGRIELKPGDSVTLVPRLYHAFWAKRGNGPALIGEVSSVNDDATDNRFNEPLPRFTSIEEDKPRRHSLVQDYEQR